MATFTNYQPGLGKVGQYQMSGVPFASSSIAVTSSDVSSVATKIEFPYVTKFVTVINTHAGTNAPMRVGFSARGIYDISDLNHGDGNNSYYFVLNNGESYTGEWRISELYLLGDESATPATASVIAGLTFIDTGRISAISGTLNDGSGANWSGSIGVG
tara:strand:+ start:192 stop:665 length:474 start_codon:yes stop_codon:yes gene_type:complete